MQKRHSPQHSHKDFSDSVQDIYEEMNRLNKIIAGRMDLKMEYTGLKKGRTRNVTYTQPRPFKVAHFINETMLNNEAEFSCVERIIEHGSRKNQHVINITQGNYDDSFQAFMKIRYTIPREYEKILSES